METQLDDVHGNCHCNYHDILQHIAWGEGREKEGVREGREELTTAVLQHSLLMSGVGRVCSVQIHKVPFSGVI